MAVIKGIKVGDTSYDIQTTINRESYEEPYYLEPQDGYEYYLSEITELGLWLPETDFYEFWIRLSWKVGDDYEPYFLCIPDLSFIGEEPEWQNGCTYEISVKNGIAVVGKVNEV